MASIRDFHTTNLVVEEQRIVLAVWTTFTAVVVILVWHGLRKWMPALSLAVRLLAMDFNGWCLSQLEVNQL